MSTKLNADYWNQRYLNNQTGWDIGHAAPALVQYAKQLASKDLKILIPGCGNAHEAVALAQLGFTDITLLDFAPLAIQSVQKKISELNLLHVVHLVCEDFFIHQGRYDIILEQTFFCALNPQLRKDYALKMYDLLKPKGKLAGLLFDFPLTDEGPPFGGSKQEYLNWFEPNFTIQTMEKANNSIEPRAGRELFFILKKG